MATDKQYRTIVGVVQFDPRDGEAAGQTVRNITVRQTGVHEKEAVNVSATLWEQFAGVEVERGDVVILEGSYQTKAGKNKSGDPVTYHNLSVNGICVFSKLDKGADVDTANDTASTTQLTDDEDLPF